MSLTQGKVKQHIDGSMQKDTAVFYSITEIGHPRIKPPISVIWMNDIMILMQCPLPLRGVNYTSDFMRDVIAYPCPNFKDCVSKPPFKLGRG